jgi:putative ABC transport system permease protein
VAFEAAVNPNTPRVPGIGNRQGGKVPASLVKVAPVSDGFSVDFVAPLYVATPSLLAHYGIKASDVGPTTDVLTSRSDLAALQLVVGNPRDAFNPKVQIVDLPRYSSAPNALITTQAVEAHGLQVVDAGWLIETTAPLTTAQIDAARRLAAAAGLSIETRSVPHSLRTLRNVTTAVGIAFALAVLAMTVGLIRSETSNDLRTLAATGAGSTTRRTITGATAGALAVLGALLGTGGAYLALVAWHHRNLHPQRHVPAANLALIVIGLPAVATAAGWLLAGREPPVMARRPLE